MPGGTDLAVFRSIGLGLPSRFCLGSLEVTREFIPNTIHPLQDEICRKNCPMLDNINAKELLVHSMFAFFATEEQHAQAGEAGQARAGTKTP